MLERFYNRGTPDEKISFKEKFSYGLGDFASQILYTPVGAFLIYYYTEIVNINIAIVATIMLVSRLFDGISDVIVGYLIEKTVSPFGKTRVWILRMLIPYFCGMVLLFSVPPFLPDVAKYIYVFFSYNLAITVVYTAINLPYGAMSTMMTRDGYERSIIVIFRMLLATAGNTLTQVAVLPMVRFFGGDQMAWTITFAILGLVGVCIFFVTFANCFERIPSSPVEKLKGRTWYIIGRMLRNKYWIMVTIAMLVIFAADIVFGTANVYFCRYFLNNAELIGLFAVVMNGFKVGSMIILLPILLRTIGKRNALLIASALIIASLALRWVNPYNATYNLVIVALYGFGQGFTYACLFAMIPDTVEYGEYTDHERHEGFLYSGASFGTKLAAGLGAVLASFVMNAGGYVNGAEVQTEEAMTSILWATSIVPVILYVLGIACMIGYHLDREYPAIIKELERRRAEAPAVDVNA